MSIRFSTRTTARLLGSVIGIGLCCFGLTTLLGSEASCTFPAADTAPDTGAFVDPDVSDDTGPILPPPTVFVDGVDQPADFTCAGRSRDAGPIDDADFDAAGDAIAPNGQLVPIAINMYAFGTGNTDKIPNSAFDVFYGNAMTDGLVPDLTVVTDATGVATFAAPVGYRISYRINPLSDPDPKKALDAYYQFDQLIPGAAGSVLDFAGMRHAEFQTLTLAITGKSEFAQKPATGIFATRVADCNRRYIANVQVDIIDVEGGPVTYGKCADLALCRLYLSDLELPSFGRDTTSRSGLVAFAGVPITSPTHHLRAVARSLLPGTTTVSVVASRDLEIHDGAVNVLYLEP